METTTNTLFGTVFHMEIRSDDPTGTAKFLADVFGWNVSDTPHPSYKMFDISDKLDGHLGPVPEGTEGPEAVNYVSVSDIEAAENAAVEGGGELLGERKEAPGQGLYTWVRIPGGIPLVLWQHLS